MPIFEFVCQECGVPFEELVRGATAVEDVACPFCESDQVVKQISTFASKVSGNSSLYSNTAAASCSTGSL
jgi:putative FmdB family regulatory protein